MLAVSDTSALGKNGPQSLQRLTHIKFTGSDQRTKLYAPAPSVEMGVP